MLSDKPTIAVLVPEKTRRQVFDPASEQILDTMGRVHWPRADRPLDREAVGALLEDADIALTGWGTPPLDPQVLSGSPHLKFVAHTAGSVRRLLPIEAIGERIRLSHAAAMIADAVAEFVIAQSLFVLRGLHRLDGGLRGTGSWLDLRENVPSGLLGARTVGIVGAGYVGRTVIRLLRGFGCRVLVADPLLTDAQAEELGVRRCALPDLLGESDIVSLHAPVLPETRGMIGAAELARLKDGALFINTARALLVDEPALLKELESGRIRACLDVFTDEPLPAGSPFRSLPNVVISPHAAGHSTDTHRAQGREMIAEIQRFLDGRPLRFEVTRSMVETMA